MSIYNYHSAALVSYYYIIYKKNSNYKFGFEIAVLQLSDLGYPVSVEKNYRLLCIIFLWLLFFFPYRPPMPALEAKYQCRDDN